MVAIISSDMTARSSPITENYILRSAFCGAAVVHDGRQTLAMLKRRPDESVEQLLQGLDRAVNTAAETGVHVD